MSDDSGITERQRDALNHILRRLQELRKKLVAFQGHSDDLVALLDAKLIEMNHLVHPEIGEELQRIVDEAKNR